MGLAASLFYVLMFGSLYDRDSSLVRDDSGTGDDLVLGEEPDHVVERKPDLTPYAGETEIPTGLHPIHRSHADVEQLGHGRPTQVRRVKLRHRHRGDRAVENCCCLHLSIMKGAGVKVVDYSLPGVTCEQGPDVMGRGRGSSRNDLTSPAMQGHLLAFLRRSHLKMTTAESNGATWAASPNRSLGGKRTSACGLTKRCQTLVPIAARRSITTVQLPSRVSLYAFSINGMERVVRSYRSSSAVESGTRKGLS